MTPEKRVAVLEKLAGKCGGGKKAMKKTAFCMKCKGKGCPECEKEEAPEKNEKSKECAKCKGKGCPACKKDEKKESGGKSLPPWLNKK